ncbi:MULTISPECIES: lysoplasmalogenase [Symbiopectobacterium]|uniref:lysoplasmalogenase n=1 Tax=Symbiopectobacterium TaxID=801 RepID=UPI001A2289C8|nr:MULTISPECIES: lysoplasmalogenase [Symbiopectobacterium]MBG6246844.1 lysoplasmalogenase [Candidatus Symbiopectobacterium sp. PLON1]MBT9430191.1 lysoplasmalogenase [Candidatus Symbiopectobacterium endolongispinus]
MLWSFIAVLFSGWLYVDASYRGPGWQRWLFKPITIALLLALAWQTPLMSVTGYFIVLGLLATLAADILLLLPIQRMMFAIGAYSACHLLYTIGFLVAKASLTFFWPLPLLLLVIIAILLAILWSRLDTLRWPVVAFVAMNAVMVWVAGEQYFALGSSNNLSWFAGSVLLFIAHGVWLIHHYRFPFRAHQAIVAASYFAGHFLIVRALYF